MAMAATHLSSPPPFDDRTSLTGSLDDFSNEEGEQRSPLFGLPSQHSGFRSSEESEQEQEEQESTSDSPWSPPMSAWRQPTSAGGWYRHEPYVQNNARLQASKSVSASRSRETSPQYESAVEEEEDTTMAAKIPLPRGSMSPMRESPVRQRSLTASPGPNGEEIFEEAEGKQDAVTGAPSPNNCPSIRISREYH